MEMLREFITTAASVDGAWSLAAFAIAATLLIASYVNRAKPQRLKPLLTISILILALALIPILAANSGMQVYRIRVTLTGESGIPVDGTKVWADTSNEVKQVSAGWEVAVPAAVLPKSKNVTVFAEKKASFLTGQETVKLDNDYNPSVTIKLKRTTGAVIQGSVLSSDGRAILNARVNAIGQEPVTSRSGGSFQIITNASVGQSVQLHAEKEGYDSADQLVLAGSTDVVMRLTPHVKRAKKR